MPFGYPDKFEVPAPKPEAAAWPQGSAPSFYTDESKKREFGIALAKEQIPFHAACSICGEDTKAAIWVSTNWINDPIVIASKDLYLKTVQLNRSLLDKDQLAARLLVFAEEKVTIGGREVYISEAKDRLKAFELYADVCGYRKTGIDNSIKNFAFTKMKIVVVEPKAKEPVTTIEHEQQPVQQSKVENALPLKLKLVG